MLVSVPRAWQTFSKLLSTSPTSVKGAGKAAFSTGHPPLYQGQTPNAHPPPHTHTFISMKRTAWKKDLDSLGSLSPVR